jgi:hypothetical protein
MINNLLQTWKEKRRFLKSKDGQFYLNQKRRLLRYPAFSYLHFSSSIFSMLRAVIILKGLQQKDKIEDYLNIQGMVSIQTHGRIKHHLIRERFLQDLQFKYEFLDEQQTIILPFFNRAMNFIYHREPDKLFDYPYSRLNEDFSTSIVDAFEHYSWSLFSSSFVQLVPLQVGDRSAQAFYQPDARVVLIINKQGRLDVSISLFDSGIKRPNLHDISKRLIPALKAYFHHDRQGFIQGLLQEGFLSPKYGKAMLKTNNASFIRREKE